ncbi:integumentary mucin C.1-like [Mugil cephalus]|uniref:integumentary mucin C.1-like n=1 Tax=Mugil cephalus TaxID=48193 RepID=UPI001FB80BEF|nr:integumentary mucin C.1-like [Mugil cephalus]
MQLSLVLTSFVCLIAWINLGHTTFAHGRVSDCCLQWSRTKLHPKQIKDYTIQSEGVCPIKAVVFLTVRGKIVCSNPEISWVKDAILKVDGARISGKASTVGMTPAPSMTSENEAASTTDVTTTPAPSTTSENEATSTSDVTTTAAPSPTSENEAASTSDVTTTPTPSPTSENEAASTTDMTTRPVPLTTSASRKAPKKYRLGKRLRKMIRKIRRKNMRKRHLCRTMKELRKCYTSSSSSPCCTYKPIRNV